MEEKTTSFGTIILRTSKQLSGWLVRQVILYGLPYLLCWYFAGHALAIIIVLIEALLIIYLKTKLRTYAGMYENIYVEQRSPDDKRVYVRAYWHRRWLDWANNQMDVQVIPLPYQEGVYCNETWEEYQDRKLAYIQNDRVLRHEELQARKLKGEAYVAKVLHQKLPTHLEKIFG